LYRHPRSNLTTTCAERRSSLNRALGYWNEHTDAMARRWQMSPKTIDACQANQLLRQVADDH
jgi:hypothetical protein